MSDTVWWRFKFTAPPRKGYVQAASEADVREFMETAHPIFAGYSNTANRVTITRTGIDTDTIEDRVSGTFKPNTAIESDGTIILRKGMRAERTREYNGRKVPESAVAPDSGGDTDE